MATTVPLPRGQTATLGVGQVKGNLTIIGVATPYTIAINGGAAAPHVAALNVPDVYAINGQSVTVVNTTVAPGPDNLTLTW